MVWLLSFLRFGLGVVRWLLWLVVVLVWVLPRLVVSGLVLPRLLLVV